MNLSEKSAVAGPLGRMLLGGVVPAAFFLVFTLFYNPFDIWGFFDFNTLGSTFHLTMLSCIVLVCLLAIRLVAHLIWKDKAISWWHIISVAAFEIVISALFCALYTWLFRHNEMLYFQAFTYCFKVLSLVLVYPYLIMLLFDLLRTSEAAAAALEDPGKGALVKFADEHGRLKFTIDSASILYLNAEYNYVHIHYLERGRGKEYVLRNSMKSLEKPAAEHGLVRCHRSYYINPRHIKVLRKDKYGFILAELDLPDTDPVPVSKNYYPAISELL